TSSRNKWLMPYPTARRTAASGSGGIPYDSRTWLVLAAMAPKLSASVPSKSNSTSRNGIVRSSLCSRGLRPRPNRPASQRPATKRARRQLRERHIDGISGGAGGRGVPAEVHQFHFGVDVANVP